MIFQNKKRHNSGAADLEKVTDYAEEKEILSTSTDLDDAIAVIRRLYNLLVSLDSLRTIRRLKMPFFLRPICTIYIHSIYFYIYNKMSQRYKANITPPLCT